MSVYVKFVADDEDVFSAVVCESHSDHCFTFVVCYVSHYTYLSAFVNSCLHLIWKITEVFCSVFKGVYFRVNAGVV